VRGDKPIDVEALCRLAAGVGRMVHDARGAIASVDLNPVMAGPDGAVVVDALIEVSGQS
jgi:hypothetical protein